MVLMMVGLAVISPWLVEKFSVATYSWPPRSLGWLEQYPSDARMKCMLSIIGATVLGGFAAAAVLGERPTAALQRSAWVAFGVMTAWAIGAFVALEPWSCFFRSHIHHNGTYAAVTCKAYAEAQEIYHRTDYDGDGVLEYASSLQQLLERTPGTGDLALIDKACAGADVSLSGPRPKAGYVFKVLLSQGPHAIGGRKGYVVREDGKEKVIGGYALVAAPAVYGGTGHDTYMISNLGTIYQKHFGEDTARFLEEVTEFDPDSTWTPAE